MATRRPRVTWLYRLYSADRLLYVGVTDHLGRRMSGHRRVQAWWPDITHGTMQPYRRRHHAELAEYRAMREENPVHNVMPLGPPFGYASVSPVPLDSPKPIPDYFLAA
jgi:predicted GIY-YIG superfamily endonuclease